MELVYLWVEEYKNIEKQGFNFSPRFKCEYDEATNELIIYENKEYVSLFPENINITAIVGENGSGKSSLLKLLHKELRIWKGKGFAIFNGERNEKFYLSWLENYPFLSKFNELHAHDKKTSFPFFEYSFTYDKDLDYENELIYPTKQINTVKGVVHLIEELLHNQKNILLNYFDLKQTKQLDKFESFFVPKTINIFFDTRTIKSKEHFPELKSTAEDQLSELKNSITHNKTTLDFIRIIKEINTLLTDRNSYEKLSNQFDYFNPKSEFKLGSRDTSEEYSNLWHESFKYNSIDLNNLSEIKKIQPVKRNEEWIDESDIHIYSFDIDKLDMRAIEVIMTSFSTYQFTVQLCDINNRVLNDLSFGEQQLLFILNQLYSLKNTQIFGNIDSYIVLLDEIDIGWHPDWQKRMLSYICNFLQFLTEKTFHLVLTTHSPFILSDLPKENVIFLEKYKKNEDANQKEGNCKNATSEINIETFGANIHTLLSDGFFMKDGLMGEFAKGKITAIKDFYEKVKKSKNPKNEHKQEFENNIENFRHIQSIIGEPFLKTIMKNYLDELELIFSDDEDLINKELKELEKRKLYLEKLKNAKN
jgi:ABC-type multidrug transport system ATPase subunit